MLKLLAILLLVALADTAEAKELRFHFVDADSRKPLPNVKMKRWASQWQPRIMLPPGKFWFPEGTFNADANGILRIEKYASDDRYSFEADGYERAGLERIWFKYKVWSELDGLQADVTKQAGNLIIPLRKSGTQ